MCLLAGFGSLIIKLKATLIKSPSALLNNLITAWIYVRLDPDLIVVKKSDRLEKIKSASLKLIFWFS